MAADSKERETACQTAPPRFPLAPRAALCIIAASSVKHPAPASPDITARSVAWLLALLASAAATGFAAEPAELRRRLLAGETIVFPANQPEAERTVPAGWLAEAARKGAAVNVTRGIITEPLDLRHAAVTNRFRLADCVFKAPANCSFAVFEQGFDLADSQFAADADFTGAIARRAALLRGTAFSGAAVFTDATAEDVFLAESAAFLGPARFERMSFLKSASFGPGPGLPAASFSGNVSFATARFVGAVDFNRVRFGSTNGTADFRETRCERTAGFRGAEFRGAAAFGSAVFLGTVVFSPLGEGPGALPAARFVGAADFSSVQFGGEADFTRVQFLKASPVNFDGSTFKDYAKFGQARFAGGALFSQASFSALADFERAAFQGTDEGPAASFQDSSLGGRASFAGGQFAGAADFRNARFGAETAFNGAVFAAEALFTYARFGHTVSFGALGGGDVPGATFADVAIFTGVKFELDAFFEKVKFTATNRPVSFSAAVFGAETAFDGAQFAGDANFVRAQFASAATFTEAAFLHPDMTAQFNSIKAGKTLNFTGARFAGPLDFVAAEAVGPVQFAGVVFGGDARFNAMAVERHAVFGPIGTNPPTHFARTADFIAVKIGGQLDLAAARFDGEALFRGASLQRGLILSWRPGATGAVQAAEFRARADFRNLQAAERVQLAGVTFHDTAAFDSTKWEVPMAFEEVRFRKGASLTRAAFPQGADFNSTRFEGLLDLTDSTFRTLRLTSLSSWTDGPIELRGATYEEFSGSVDALLEAFTRADRPVLTRLERSLRQVGRDDEADAVYLQNQHRERRQCWTDHKYGEWFFRSLYGGLGNYGVRPYRLLVFSAVLVWLGALVFQLPGAVAHKDKAAKGTELTTFDAVALSICYFLPVEFPLEEEWIAATSPLTYHLPLVNKPIQVRPAAIANFVLRLSGWIVVPLALAAVTGLLKTNG
jgi:hypothetical protein